MTNDALSDMENESKTNGAYKTYVKFLE